MIVAWSEEAEAGSWIAEQLHAFGTDVGSLIPARFQSYLRILHPVSWETPDGRFTIRWTELFSDASLTVGPATRFDELPRLRDDAAPVAGSLDLEHVSRLAGILASHTATPDNCWFGLWDGYGWMTGRPAIVPIGGDGGDGASTEHVDRIHTPELPTHRLHLPERSFALHCGPITSATAFCRFGGRQSPNLWWPEDRSWFIASEIDLHSTYVGGTARLIEELSHEVLFESLLVGIDERVG